MSCSWVPGALQDEILRVRRQAVLLLAWNRAHPDLESDAKLRHFARLGVEWVRSQGAGASRC